MGSRIQRDTADFETLHNLAISLRFRPIPRRIFSNSILAHLLIRSATGSHLPFFKLIPLSTQLKVPLFHDRARLTPLSTLLQRARLRSEVELNCPRSTRVWSSTIRMPSFSSFTLTNSSSRAIELMRANNSCRNSSKAPSKILSTSTPNREVRGSSFAS